MALSGIKTLPLLRGFLRQASPWGTDISRSGWRIYPFQLGCKVRLDTTTQAVYTFGMGDFVANDYVMVCQQIYYDNGYFYIPRTNQLSRIQSVGTVDDQLTLTVAIVANAGDYLLNLGADTAATPLSAPNYDGSTLTLYGDNVGGGATLGDYVLTGEKGQYECWLPSGTLLTDLLITDSSGQPQLVYPYVALGPEVD